MTDCPYCHSNTTIRYSPLASLHIVRSIIGSDKRYCSHCEKKWKVRSRRKRVNTSFYAVAIPLTLVFSLGMFHFTDGRSHASSTLREISSGGGSTATSGGPVGEIGLGSEVSFLMSKAGFDKSGNLKGESSLLAGLSSSQQKMAQKALKTMSKEDIQSKLKKLGSNPQALAKLTGERKEVVEQALKLMKNQSRR